MKNIVNDARTIKTGTQYRTFEVDRASIDKEARTVTLSFSSETPVDRWFGFEILDHSPASIRMNRLKDGGPLLVNHDGRDQIGVVESAEIGPDKKGRAVLRFGKSTRAQEIFDDVLDGIRRNVSVGYWVHRMVLEEEDDEKGNTYRAMDWEPLEISIVPVPADISVGVGRSRGEGDHETIIERSIKMPEPVVEKVDVKKIEADAQNAEHTRVNEILAIGDQHKCQADAARFIRERKSVEDFKNFVLETRYKAKPVDVDPNIGMSDKERSKYSLLRAIRQAATEGGRLDGIEKEASDAVAKLCGRNPRGFFIPNDILMEKRDMGAQDAAKGGYTVGTDLLSGSMIELYRNKTLVVQMGARTLSGLVGNIAIPRVTGGATAYWLPETGAVTKSDQAFGQLALTPKRLVGDTVYSKELLMQSSIDVENFIRQDLMTVLALEKDRAAINGSAASGEPTGILNTTGIISITFGAAPTWAKVVDFETQVADNNADVGALGYLTTPVVRGKWKTTVKATSTAVFLWGDGDMPVNGYRAGVTKQVPSNRVIFGNFADLIIGEWAGIDVVVDPYSLKKNGQIEVTITLWTDIGIRHAVSFAASTDSGAQ